MIVHIDLMATGSDAMEIAKLLRKHMRGGGWYAMVIEDAIKSTKENKEGK